MEYPHLVDLYNRLGGDHFTILSIETTNRPELAKKYIDEVGATFPILVDDQKAMRALYEIKGVPTNLMIDRDGRVIFRHLGFSEGQERMLEAEVRILLGSEGAIG